jgi:hypothetical protein
VTTCPARSVAKRTGCRTRSRTWNLLIQNQARCQFRYPARTTMNYERGTMKFDILNSSFIVPNSAFRLVDLARFERATSTFAELRSNSAELQVLRFRIANFGLWIRRNRTNLQSAFCNQQSTIAWRRRQELNLHATVRGGLADRCHTVRRRLREQG